MKLWKKCKDACCSNEGQMLIMILGTLGIAITLELLGVI